MTSPELVPKLVRYYGCVPCQAQHWEGDRLFESHLLFQSKHGLQYGHRTEQPYPALQVKRVDGAAAVPYRGRRYCLCNHTEEEHLITGHGPGACCFCSCTHFEWDPLYDPALPVRCADGIPATVDCGWCDGKGMLTTGKPCDECHGTGAVIYDAGVAR